MLKKIAYGTVIVLSSVIVSEESALITIAVFAFYEILEINEKIKKQ